MVIAIHDVLLPFMGAGAVLLLIGIAQAAAKTWRKIFWNKDKDDEDDQNA